MEEQIRKHTAKLERCLEKFDQLLFEVAELKSVIPSLPTKAEFVEINERLAKLENLEKRAVELEDNQLTAMNSLERAHGRLDDLPSAEEIRTRFEAIQAPLQAENEQIKDIEGAIQGINARISQLNEQYEQTQNKVPGRVLELDSAFALLTEKIAHLEEQLDKSTLAVSGEIDNVAVKTEDSKIDAILDKYDNLTQRLNAFELNLTENAEQQIKILGWINQENIRPDLDRLTNQLSLMENKFDGLESSIVSLSKELVQSEELEIRMNALRREVSQNHRLAGQHETASVSDEKHFALKREVEKIKADMIWGIQEMRQRIDSFLINIRTELFEENKKQYQKFIQVEMEQRKQIRIANALYAEIANLKRSLPGESGQPDTISLQKKE